METEYTETFSNKGTRNEVRMRVVNRLSLETPGTGKNNLAQRFKYYTETLADGNRIYLRRPASLHNGFDFLVRVENYNFNVGGERSNNAPKHSNIIEDLTDKKKESPLDYIQLIKYLEGIYLCKIEAEVIPSIGFSGGYSVELLGKVCKWLFIEQDIRYWNYSGRGMLWDEIKKL